MQGCELHLTGGLPALFLQPQVERGVEGEELGRMDRSDLFENLFSTHDSADAYYRDFATHDRRGDWSLLLSMVVAVAGIGLDLDVVWDDDLVAAAVGFLALGQLEYNRARNDFGKAMDWYNRSLPPTEALIDREPRLAPRTGRRR